MILTSFLADLAEGHPLEYYFMSLQNICADAILSAPRGLDFTVQHVIKAVEQNGLHPPFLTTMLSACSDTKGTKPRSFHADVLYGFPS